MDTQTHTHKHTGPSSCVCPVSTPSQWIKEEILIQEAAGFFLSPSFLPLLSRSLSSSDFSHCPGMARMSSRCTRLMKERYTEGEIRPPAAFPASTSCPPSPPSSKRKLLCRGESPKLVVKLPAMGEREEKQQQCQTLLCFFLLLSYKMASLNRKL